MSLVSLFAVFLTTRGSPRVPVLDGTLNSSPWSLPGFRYYFVNWSSKNETRPPSLVPPVEYERLVDFALSTGRNWLRGRKSPELFADLFFALDFYLQNSTASWFFRGTDDTILNLPLLPDYLHELQAKHNPLVDLVALGNCLAAFWRRFPYPHGGAGYLFSRAASRRIAGMARQILADGWGDEDAVVGEVLHDLGVKNFTSDRFIGFEIDRAWRNAIIQGAYATLPNCSAVSNEGACTPFLSPLRNIIFFHQTMPFDAYYVTLAKMTFAAPPDIMWWMSGYVPQICREASPTSHSRRT